MLRSFAAAAIGTVLLTTACGGSEATPSAAAPASGTTVDMVFTEFKQTDVTIKAGETLTFVNANPIEHVIVQGPWKAGSDELRTTETDDGTFRLEVAKKGERVEHTFAQAGTFQFFCTIHKGMNGTVTVT